jgi:hypothetical protein
MTISSESTFKAAFFIRAFFYSGGSHQRKEGGGVFRPLARVFCPLTNDSPSQSSSTGGTIFDEMPSVERSDPSFRGPG